MSTSAPLATASDLHSLVLLAEELDENKVTPGVLGFLVFAVMGLAIWWLMRSMTRRMTAFKDKGFDGQSKGEPGSTTDEGSGDEGSAEPDAGAATTSAGSKGAKGTESADRSPGPDAS